MFTSVDMKSTGVESSRTLTVAFLFHLSLGEMGPVETPLSLAVHVVAVFVQKRNQTGTDLLLFLGPTVLFVKRQLANLSAVVVMQPWHLSKQ